MAKIVLNDITNVEQVSVINDNFDKIELELQNKVYYRNNPVGEPNTLETDLDANGHAIYNVGELRADNVIVDGVDIGDAIQTAVDAAADAEESAEDAEDAQALAEAAAAAAASTISPVSVANYAELRAYVGPAAQVHVTGFSLSAAPSPISGAFTRDVLDVSSADNGGTIIVSVNGIRWKRVIDDGVVNTQWFGTVADGTTGVTTGTDNFPMFRAALDFCRLFKYTQMVTPAGLYFVSAELEIDLFIHWRGGVSHTFNFDVATTQLNFPPDVNGIRVCRGVTSTSGGNGADSILERICVFGRSVTTATMGNGIQMDARAKCVDVVALNFGQDGFNIDATATSVPSKNANLWSLERCKADGNNRDGFYVNGADANAGYAIGCNANNNGRNGITDSSFLGNTWVGCHTSDNGKRAQCKGSNGIDDYWCILDHVTATDTIPTTGANWPTYWVARGTTGGVVPAPVIGRTQYVGGHGYMSDSNNAKTVFVGCYAESGQSRNPSIIYPSMVVGGSMGTVDPEFGEHAVRPGIRPTQAITKDSAGDFITSSFGGFRETTQLNHMTWQYSTTGTGWRFEYDKVNGVWNWWNGSTANRAFRMKDNAAVILTNLPVGSLDFGIGLAIVGNRHWASAAEPATGTWARGDVIWNTTPSAGGSSGWRCTTAGIAGSTAVFRRFGIINNTNTYAATNVTTDRTYDANATTLDEVADVLGTLINDLRTAGFVT